MTQSSASRGTAAARDMLSGLPDLWHQAPRRWGHPLHSICSYFAMFPPQLASVFIRWLTNPGDSVYDPFSGRGTVPLEAVLHGRRGFGSDANPLAHALTRAKVTLPSERTVLARLDLLERRFRSTRLSTEAVPDPIRMLYAPGTLQQLVFLREQLGANRRADPFIRALILGMLHANHSSRGATRGFSISMPNTFAMGPGYVREYIARNRLVAPELDVFEMLRRRARRYGLPRVELRGGRAWLRDATGEPPAQLRRQPARLVVTSPPYLQVIKYGKYNWVRLWFLGETAPHVDAKLMASGSLTVYLSFMARVLRRLRGAVAEDGFVCLVIGDVRQGTEDLNLAGKVWRYVAEPDGWSCHALIRDSVPSGVKVSRIWKSNPGRATKVDRVLLLSPSSNVRLPALVDIDWSRRPALLRQETREEI